MPPSRIFKDQLRKVVTGSRGVGERERTGGREEGKKGDRMMKDSGEHINNIAKIFFQTFSKRGMTSKIIINFRQIIYAYYNKYARDLPWRNINDPYRILVSEIMLQQTRIERVLQKYPLFIKTFPDFITLAHASLQEVLIVWQGMGYNRRALALHKIAQIVAIEHNSILPSSLPELIALPGIGKTTASAIMAFAFNQPVSFIETNIRSVFIYFFFPHQTKVKDAEIFPFIEKTLDSANPRAWYYALMDYGTMLKKNYPNPGRKSAHYHTQSPFQGSDRQIRGMILRALTHKHALSIAQLLQHLHDDPTRTQRILAQLLKEGFIQKHKAKYQLATS